VKQYIKNYFDSIGEPPNENVKCEVCGARAVDIHHIDARGMGGSKLKDGAENLVALCRSCHEKFEGRKQHKEQLKTIAAERMRKAEKWLSKK